MKKSTLIIHFIKKTITKVIICSIGTTSVFAQQTFNNQAQVDLDDPYGMRKLWIDIEPTNFDFHKQNPANISFGLRSTYHLNAKISVYSDLYVSYFDMNKLMIRTDEKVSRFSKIETHLSYDFINIVKEKNVAVVTHQESNYSEAKAAGSDKYYIKSYYITVPGKVRRTVSLHTSADLFRSSIIADDDKKINYQRIDNVPDSLRYFSSSKINASYFQPVIAAGLSFKKMVNVQVTYQGVSGFFSNFYNTKGLDLLFAPFHTITNAKDGEKLRAVDFINFGWRYYYELRPFLKSKKLNHPNFGSKIGMFLKFEFGQRPGIRGNRAYFNCGFGWRLVDL
jgi:hypothetical protein